MMKTNRENLKKLIKEVITKILKEQGESDSDKKKIEAQKNFILAKNYMRQYRQDLLTAAQLNLKAAQDSAKASEATSKNLDPDKARELKINNDKTRNNV